MTETLIPGTRSAYDSSRPPQHQVRASDYRWVDRRLEHMFAPPVDMMEAGDMGIARERASAERKWLLFNIQDKEDFTSHLLNRDVWRAAGAVKNLVNSRCIFQQHERTSPDGMQFLQHYHAKGVPTVAFVDPNTLECSLLLDDILFDLPGKKQTFIRTLERFLTDNPVPPSVAQEDADARLAQSSQGNGGMGSLDSLASLDGLHNNVVIDADSGDIVLSGDEEEEDPELAAALRASRQEMFEQLSKQVEAQKQAQNRAQNQASGAPTTKTTTSTPIRVQPHKQAQPQTRLSSPRTAAEAKLEAEDEASLLNSKRAKPSASFSSAPAPTPAPTPFFSTENRVVNSLVESSSPVAASITSSSTIPPNTSGEDASLLSTVGHSLLDDAATATSLSSSKAEEAVLRRLLAERSVALVGPAATAGPTKTRIQILSPQGGKSVGVFEKGAATPHDLYVFAAHFLADEEKKRKEAGTGTGDAEESLLRPFNLVTRLGRKPVEESDRKTSLAEAHLANATVVIEYDPHRG